MEARHKLILNLFFLCVLSPALRSNFSLSIITRIITKNHTLEFTGVNFKFDESDQILIYESFTWGYLISPFFAGILSCKFGGKWVGGFAMVTKGMLCMALPQIIIRGSRDLLICLRILQGVSAGLVISAFTLLGKWIPPKERAFLCSICLSGIPLGSALTILFSTYLTPIFGWSSVFYTPGLITTTYFSLWIGIVHESPQVDPNISSEELKYLTRSLKIPEQANQQNGAPKNEPNIPWKAIFTSVPFWAVFASQFCNVSGDFLISSFNIPKYSQSEFQLNVQMYGGISALRYLTQFVFMIVVGFLCDFLIGRNVFTILAARKLCNSVGQWGYALILAGLMCSRWYSDSSSVILICYIFSGMINGAVVPGSRINIIDLSPKYSPVVNGMIISCANITGLGLIYAIRHIICGVNAACMWYVMLGVPIFLNIVGNFVFIIGADANLQYWHFSDKTKTTVII